MLNSIKTLKGYFKCVFLYKKKLIMSKNVYLGDRFLSQTEILLPNTLNC